jgi:riboflavin transporter FmnP
MPLKRGYFYAKRRNAFMKSSKVQRMTTLAMLTAVAYAFMLVTRLHITFIPSLPFLSYDPKDIVIVIAGFIYGPVSALLVAFAVAFLELVTVSTTGPIGFAMNVLATSAFCCTAAFLYKRNHTRKGAIAGLVAGVAMLTAVMALWNIIVTPIYMHIPREVVAGMILPAFVPFNLLKGGLNAAASMFLYKPVVSMLRRARLVNPEAGEKHGIAASSLVVSAVIIVVCVVAILLIKASV